MNAADDGEVNPEPLSPGGELPLSAPVAGSVLQTRRLDIPRQEASGPYGPAIPVNQCRWSGPHQVSISAGAGSFSDNRIRVTISRNRVNN